MPYIQPKGNPAARLWFVFDKPYSTDVEKASLISGPIGYVLIKMLQEAHIDPSMCYFCCRRPDTDSPMGFTNINGSLSQHQPPLVVAVGDAAGWFLPELREKSSGTETSKGQMYKYAGSLLQSSNLSYPHYCIPMHDLSQFAADWQERNVTTYIDLQKIRDELDYWKQHGQLQLLPTRVLKFQDMELDELLSYFDRFSNAKILADDIENPVYNSKQYAPHPGYPFLLGLADSKDFGVSFKLFREKPSENRELWRRLDKLLYEVPILLGQNIFNYDAMFHEALGFRVRLDRIQDTLIRHHILWPELSHKLQFLTRQYTREPYYKDEGHSWSMKYLNRYRRYNALDACVTFEVYEGQEQEFQQKPHLR